MSSYFEGTRPSSRNTLYSASSIAPPSSSGNINPGQSMGTASLNQLPSHARSSLSQVTNATNFSHSGISLGHTTSNLQLGTSNSTLDVNKTAKFGATASTAKWSSGSPILGSTSALNQGMPSFAAATTTTTTAALPSLSRSMPGGPLSALLDKRHEQQQASTLSFKDITQQPYTAHPARERKYYEAAFRQSKAKTPSEAVVEREQARTSSEDAPPKSTLYEFTLSPDMRHAQVDKASLKYHRMDSEDSKGSSSAPVVTRDTEVTVFGFPSSASAAVLEVFRQIGTVEHYEVGAGNWLHITYASSWSANKALSKNGKILPTGAFMIGVVPGKEARTQLSTAGESFLTPIKGGTGTTGTPLKVSFAPKVDESVFSADTPVDTTTIFRKPLKRTYEETVSPGEDNSLLTKLVKYVFGW